MRIFAYIILVVGSCFVYSCGEDTPIQEEQDNELSLFYGSFGGLCGYSDSLSISPSLDTYFDMKSECDNVDYDISKTINQTKYDNLLESFSLSDFEKMNVNSCDRCVDGIDNFLYITGPNFGHRIVFSESDNINDIEELVDELNDIRESHKSE